MTTAPCTNETCPAVLPGDQEVYNVFYTGDCNAVFTAEWAYWFDDEGYQDFSGREDQEDFENMVAITASRAVVALACSLV